MSTQNLCFEQKYEKYQNLYLKCFNFLVLKFSVYLNRHIFVMWINFASLAMQNVASEDSDQTARMRRLIWIFAGRKCPKVRFLTLQHNRKRSLCNLHVDQFVHSTACITKTYLYNFDPLKPHFYVVKLGFTGVYIIILISAQKHRLWVLVRTASARRF